MREKRNIHMKHTDSEGSKRTCVRREGAELIRIEKNSIMNGCTQKGSQSSLHDTHTQLFEQMNQPRSHLTAALTIAIGELSLFTKETWKIRVSPVQSSSH